VGGTIAELFLPTFNELTGSELSIDFLKHGWLPSSLFGLTALVGVGAGSYPALVLCRFRTTEIFRGKFRIGGKNLLTRSLVVAQFCLSIFLIVSTIIMNRQQNFMRNTNLGFDKDQIVVIPTQLGRGNKEEGDLILSRFKNELSTIKQVVRVSGASGSFGRGNSAEFKTKDDGSRVITFLYRVDLDYLSTLDIQLLEGRDFSPEFASDFTESVIVNEAFLREFEIEEPLGYNLPRAFASIENAKIIGVVNDYHFQKLHSKIYPMMLYMAETASINHVLVKLKPEAFTESVANLERIWKAIRPDRPFEYSFLDEDVDKQYRVEMNWSRAVGYASVFAVVIACLGLLGLTMLTVTRRTKEIGVRKVLGAPVASIIQLLSGEFTKLVLMANVIAWPMAYLAVNQWLQRFAYRIDIGLSYFIVAAVLSLSVALFTISFQALRAALSNPVDSLRYE
jgi:putative ABC transport system permease protein